MKAVWREIAKSVRERRNRFAQVIAWLARDSAVRFGWRIPAAFVLSIVGLGLSIAALGVVAIYAHHLESGAALSMGGHYGLPAWNLAPKEPRALLAAAAMAAAAIAAGALCRYASEAWLLRVAARYEAFCIRRASAVAGRLPMWVSYVHDWRLNKTFLSSLTGPDSRMCGRSLRTLVEGTVAPVALIGLFGLLAWLDWILTLELIGIGLLLSPLVLGRVIRAAELTREHELARANSRLEQAMMRTHLSNGTLPTDKDHWLYDEILGQGEIGRGIEIFGKRLIVLRQTSLMTFVIFGAMLFVMIGHGGARALAGEQSWTEFIFYILVMRVNLGYLVGLTSAAAQLGRFYPGVNRYFSLLDAERGLRARNPPGTDCRDCPATLEVQGRSLDDSKPGLEITAGTRLGLITDAPADRFIVGTVAQHVVARHPGDMERLLKRASIISGNVSLARSPLRDAFGFADTVTCEELSRELHETGCVDAASFLEGKDLDAPLTATQLHKRPDYFDDALQALAAAKAPYPALVCSYGSLRRLPDTLSRKLFNTLDDRVWLIVYPIHVSVGQLLSAQEAGILAMRDDRLLWQMPAASVSARSLRVKKTLARLQRESGRRVRGAGAAGESDFEED